jgi:hypothetical protein
MVKITSSVIDELKILPRLMMLAITIMCFQVTNWMISLEDPTLNQSGFCSVIFGCFSACFAVWLGKEAKTDRGVSAHAPSTDRADY